MIQFPLTIVCPVCKGRLEQNGKLIHCIQCSKNYKHIDGIPDLIVGDRFEDSLDEGQLCYEDQSNTYSTKQYLLPLFKKLWPANNETLKILSLGCGTGIDVDILCEEGYNCVGIDCGNRTQVWKRRVNKNHYLLANGKRLPFESSTFDGIFCGCVFPHVGVVGDSYQVTDNYYNERLALAKEMTRVLKPSGNIIVSSPNRFFPFDIFHGRKVGSYKPRLYWPGDPFLFSVGDYRRLFQTAGCANVKALPVQDYWGFIRSKNSIKGILFGLPTRILFWLVSCKGFSILRGSPLNPWIVILVKKRTVSDVS